MTAEKLLVSQGAVLAVAGFGAALALMWREQRRARHDIIEDISRVMVRTYDLERVEKAQCALLTSMVDRQSDELEKRRERGRP